MRIKLQTLITDLSTKVFRITSRRPHFIKGSAAQAKDRIQATGFFFIIVTSQLAVDFIFQVILCKFTFVFYLVSLWWGHGSLTILKDIPLLPLSFLFFFPFGPTLHKLNTCSHPVRGCWLSMCSLERVHLESHYIHMLGPSSSSSSQ